MMHLTPREKECLELILLGKSSQEIARQLDLNASTVQFYFRNLQIKLGCHSIKQLIKNSSKFF